MALRSFPRIRRVRIAATSQSSVAVWAPLLHYRIAIELCKLGGWQRVNEVTSRELDSRCWLKDPVSAPRWCYIA